MSSYDVTDSAVIDATPERVFALLVDEYAGRTHWWTQVESKPVGDIPFGELDAVWAFEGVRAAYAQCFKRSISCCPAGFSCDSCALTWLHTSSWRTPTTT